MLRCVRNWWLGAVAVLALAAPAPAVQAAAPLQVIIFPGVHNLPLYAAQAKGFFAMRGLNVNLEFTPNSQVLRDGLANGTYDIAYTAADNGIAMVELAKVDVVIVTGGDSSLNGLYVQLDIQSYADLLGKTVVVDAPNTAYALLLYKMLQLNGLRKGEYVVKPIGGTSLRLEAMRKERSHAAAMMDPPFSILAEKEGFRRLGLAVQVIGPYQARSTFVLRAWARAHADTLVRYIQAHVEGLRWAMNPANKAEAVALLAQRLKLGPDVALKCWELAADPVNGFAKDARFDLEGFKNVLKLRAEIEGQWGGTPPAPERYLDLSYYERALAGL